MGCPSTTPDDGPPGRGALRLPADAGGVCGVVRLSAPALRSELHGREDLVMTLLGEGDDGGWLLC